MLNEMKDARDGILGLGGVFLVAAPLSAHWGAFLVPSRIPHPQSRLLPNKYTFHSSSVNLIPKTLINFN
jgi:hypothetical protein